MNIRVGQAIEYETKNSGIVRGVISKVCNEYLEFFEVKHVTSYTRCYDELGAVRETDANKVKLRDCPSPFVSLSKGQKGGVYALADIDNPLILTKEDYLKYHVKILDDGDIISERDMYAIFHHPWLDQQQKELRRQRRLSELDDKFGDIGSNMPTDEFQKE